MRASPWPFALAGLWLGCDVEPPPQVPAEPVPEVQVAAAPRYDVVAEVEPSRRLGQRAAPAVSRPRSSFAPRSKALLVTELQALASLLSATPKTSPDRPKLMRRMAEDYRELEGAAERDAAEAKEDAERTKSATIARSARREAIRYGRLLVSEYPTWCASPNAARPEDSRGCNDETLAALAGDLERAGQDDDARKVYLDLVEHWPASRLLPDAYGAFGEMFAGEAAADPVKWQLARQAYAEALKTPAPDNRNWAYWQYKLAYVDWNLGDAAAATAGFQSLIDFATAHPETPQAAELLADARAAAARLRADAAKAGN